MPHTCLKRVPKAMNATKFNLQVNIHFSDLTTRLTFTMNTKITDNLQARLDAAQAGSAAFLTITFLQGISARQQALGLGNAELARRMGTTPAYITRLFQTSANLSLHTMTRLATAVGGSVQVGVDGGVS